MYYLVAWLLRVATPDNRLAIVIAMAFKNASIVTPDMVEDALQKCFLDPEAVSSNLGLLEKTFNLVTKAFAEWEVIAHLPTLQPTETVSEEKQKEEKKEEKGQEEEEEEKEVVLEKQEEFVNLLNEFNLAERDGDELADEVKNLGIPAHPRRNDLHYSLLYLISYILYLIFHNS